MCPLFSSFFLPPKSSNSTIKAHSSISPPSFLIKLHEAKLVPEVANKSSIRRTFCPAEKAGVKTELHYLRNSYIKALVDSDKSAKEIAELTDVSRVHAKTLIKLFSKN